MNRLSLQQSRMGLADESLSYSSYTFGDPATLRRELVNMKLLGRESDCSRYWKEPRRPDADTRAFLQAWRARYRG